MDTWSDMPIEDEEACWERFHRRFAFRPSVDASRWPAIDEPEDSVTYGLVHVLAADDTARKAAEREARRVFAAAFRDCVPEGGRLAALDWQHPCSWLDPRGLGDTDEDQDEWAIPLLPDGDYFLFVDEGLRFGVFGHPWERTLCVFGQPLLDALGAASDTAVFGQPVRRGGRSVAATRAPHAPGEHDA